MPVELVPTGADNPVEVRCQSSDRQALLSVLDRILDRAASLPCDLEVMRDLTGSLRTLAALDSAVLEHLEDYKGRSMPGSARAEVVHAALTGLVQPARRPDAGGIMPGHDWSSAPFVLGRGYER
jgi:hypothetical protein